MIWRGPMLHGAVTQFLRDTDWGELDYLIIDMPPGTGDIALTLSQLLPLTGAVVVCTPQDVALLDAVKAIAMFRRVNIPILGMVENMSGFVCPHCGKRYDIFGSGGARQRAEDLDVPFLGEVPINVQIRELGDAGQTDANFENPAVAPHLERIAYRLVKHLATRPPPRRRSRNCRCSADRRPQGGAERTSGQCGGAITATRAKPLRLLSNQRRPTGFRAPAARRALRGATVAAAAAGSRKTRAAGTSQSRRLCLVVIRLSAVRSESAAMGGPDRTTSSWPLSWGQLSSPAFFGAAFFGAAFFLATIHPPLNKVPASSVSMASRLPRADESYSPTT